MPLIKRKRNAVNNIDRQSALVKGQDKRRDSVGYWDDRLKRMGLTPDAGRRPWLDYGIVYSTVVTDGHSFYTKEHGESLERNEWPLSLY